MYIIKIQVLYIYKIIFFIFIITLEMSKKKSMVDFVSHQNKKNSKSDSNHGKFGNLWCRQLNLCINHGIQALHKSSLY